MSPDDDRTTDEADRPDWFGAGDDAEAGSSAAGRPAETPDWFGGADPFPTERAEAVGEQTAAPPSELEDGPATNGATAGGGGETGVADADAVELDGEVETDVAGDVEPTSTAEAGATGRAEPVAEEPTAGPDPTPEPSSEPSGATSGPEAEEPTAGMADTDAVELDGEVETDVAEPAPSAAAAPSSGAGDDAEAFEDVEDDADSGGLIGWIKSIFGL
jgi:hypothetical protein